VVAKPKTARWDLVGAITAVTAVAALGIGFYNVGSDRSAAQTAHANDVRAARHEVIEDVLQMRLYDSEGGAGNQHEILVLAADATALIDRFGQAELHLSPLIYRLMAEYVAYSTKQPEIAERLARKVIEFGDPESDDLVFAHRVLGHVAAQRLEPDEFAQQYDEAIALNQDFLADQPNLGREVDEFTRAYRLLSAYLGALRSGDSPVREEFCALAESWEGDRALVARLATKDRVPGQLRRFHARNDLERLWAVCA
jgi:hypothetical protein